jgi:DNA-binding PadR family transcriptional regulator
MKDYYDMFSRLGLLYRKDYSLTEKGKAVLRHYLKSLEKE